jgi:murein L,D-transpeptidase YcbB/YkuD
MQFAANSQSGLAFDGVWAGEVRERLDVNPAVSNNQATMHTAMARLKMIPGQWISEYCSRKTVIVKIMNYENGSSVIYDQLISGAVLFTALLAGS